MLAECGASCLRVGCVKLIEIVHLDGGQQLEQLCLAVNLGSKLEMYCTSFMDHAAPATVTCNLGDFQ